MQLDLVEYLLATADGSTDLIATKTSKTKVNTVNKLRKLSSKMIQAMVDADKIAEGNLIVLITLQNVIEVLKEELDGDALPVQLSMWKEEVSIVSIKSFDRKPKSLDSTGDKDTLKQKSGARVRMSDYAKFSGQQRDWYTFKIETEATAQVQGMADIMRLKPGDEQAEIEHLAKQIDNVEYDNRVTCMFSILKRFTARGIALSKVATEV